MIINTQRYEFKEAMMASWMRQLLMMLLFSFLAFSGFCQATTSMKLPAVIPLSPEAASLGRYGEVAVGEYTGTPNISVPLHVIKSGKLEFPLNLYYDASGVRVNQDATWVGLSWELSAVAGITYIPSGGNDQSITTPEPLWQDWDNLMVYVSGKTAPSTRSEDGFYGWGCTVNGQPPVITKPDLMYLGLQGRAQRDLYSVNCPGFSFKFYIHPQSGLPKILGDKSNFKVEFSGNIGFKITDEGGTVYSFLIQERTPVDDSNLITHWYLSGIMSPDGEGIQFRYANYGEVRPLPTLSEQFTHVISGNPQQSTMKFDGDRFLQRSSVLNQYLTEIESSREVVTFNLSNNRTDIPGDGARRLENISIEDKFTHQKKIVAFEYGYFLWSSVGGNYLHDGTLWNWSPSASYSEDNLRTRLKLMSVVEKDDQNTENKKYTFDYDETIPLPYKTSFSVDHWGYYNGQENASYLLDTNLGDITYAAHTIIPKLITTFLNPTPPTGSPLKNLDLYDGAFRGASVTFSKSGSLKSIAYPTRGKSVFTYEPNSFKNATLLSAEEEYTISNVFVQKTVYDFNNNDPLGPSSTFTLSAATSVHISGVIQNLGTYTSDQMAGTSVTLSGPSGVVKSWNAQVFNYGTTYRNPIDEDLLLTAGSYTLSCSLPDALGPVGYNSLVTATYTYRDLEGTFNKVMASHWESIGGGLRIKTIANYDADNSLISTKEYRYTEEDGTTSGKLISPVGYSYSGSYQTGSTSSGGDCVHSGLSYYKRLSSNIFGLSTSPIKATVGYGRVEIVDLIKNGSTGNGSTIKVFNNDAVMGTFFNDILLNYPEKNGILASVTYKNETGTILRQEEYDYEISDIEMDWINTKINDNYIGPIGECTSSNDGTGIKYDICAYIGRYTIGVYPYINYKKLLARKTVKDYPLTGGMTQQSAYSYDADTYQLIESVTSDSKQEVNVVRYKYPPDFVNESSVYLLMKESNRLNEVIEQVNIKNNVQLSRIKTNYSLVDDFLIKPVTVEQQIKDNPTSVEVTYGRYSRGNVSQFLTKEGVYNSFVWGYDQTLPIAKAENALLSDIFYTGFEDVDGNNNEAKTGRESHVGIYSKALTNLTNGNYILSYWLKSGSEWILQVNSITVSANTYTISFASDQQVDDVRFYPQGARMSTYTHDPIYGMTSITDENNVISFFEYDTFGRLKLMKDKKGNILKYYKYHYNGEQ